MPRKNPVAAKEYKSGYYSQNKDRILQEHKEYYKQNAEKKKAYARQQRIHQKERMREARLARGGACERCGYNDCLAALDFHHPDDNKEGTVAVAKGWSDKRFYAEVAKCEMICANCHRKEHWPNP